MVDRAAEAVVADGFHSGLGDLASAAGTSRHHLSRVFRAVTGMTFTRVPQPVTGPSGPWRYSSLRATGLWDGLSTHFITMWPAEELAKQHRRGNIRRDHGLVAVHR